MKPEWQPEVLEHRVEFLSAPSGYLLPPPLPQSLADHVEEHDFDELCREVTLTINLQRRTKKC